MIILLKNNKIKTKNILYKSIRLKNIVRHYPGPGNKGSMIKPIKDLSKPSSNALTPIDKKHPNYKNVIAYQKYKENRKKLLDNTIIKVEKNTFDKNNEKAILLKKQVVEQKNVALLENAINTIINYVSEKGIKKEVLISASGKEYTTSLTEHMDISSLTDNIMLQELYSRGLITEIKSDTSIKMITEDNDVLIVGKASNKFKLSVLGQAYVEIMQTQEVEREISNITLNENRGIHFHIGVVKNITKEHSLVTTAIQKHMLIANIVGNNQNHVIGYLTSKQTSEPLCNEKFYEYQQRLLNNGLIKDITLSTENLRQRFKPFSFARLLHNDDIIFLKWGPQYIEQLSNKIKQDLYNLVEKLMQRPLLEFSIGGLSIQQAYDMCLFYDTLVKDKSKHPITEEQYKINIEHTAKLEEKNLAFKRGKTKVIDETLND
jgi:hypothetical protein